jgi:hypothetical protein
MVKKIYGRGEQRQWLAVVCTGLESGLLEKEQLSRDLKEEEPILRESGEKCSRQ